MPEIVYVEPNGTRHSVIAAEDQTVMEGAVLNMLPGIEGMCGGLLSCATCHCYVAEEWADRLDAPRPEERDMLELVTDRQPNSRLGCQIRLTADLAGLVIHLPEEA